ncbi:uncharacterized protein LOC121837193 [Ixodes scapularis]|uniref:uncharacterized protein LOC121837193 n=1 Tax=Ixodes scapularis TaxID=6945 RepID=UPI001C38299E|nr:uncharacterized protein LOC121837193 [Ixodes scapularis]
MASNLLAACRDATLTKKLPSLFILCESSFSCATSMIPLATSLGFTLHKDALELLDSILNGISRGLVIIIVVIRHCFRSNYVCLVVLPCPGAFIESFRACIESFRALLLLLCGDVEKNPGPMSKQQEDEFLALVQTVAKLQSSLALLQQEVNLLTQKNIESEKSASSLEERVNNLTTELDLLKQKEIGNVTPTEPQLTTALNELSQLKTRCDDAEGRSRRNNLLFFGVTDTDRETWAQSEGLVTGLCSSNLGVNIESSKIERAHPLGAFNPQKCRPIIVKFSSFKDKEGILSSAFKLKGTRVAISEDFPISVRLARRHLLDFAKPKGTTYKLRHDKLFLDNKCYVYDAALGAVREKCIAMPAFISFFVTQSTCKTP